MPVRQLPEQIVNRIAAGEVVERPASVVKELVENAIDAGASRIDIFTDGGGRRRIGITDDGSGMTHADLALAVDRHATSKLDDEDLLRIRTLGFRGEALPSIGAVAQARHHHAPRRRAACLVAVGRRRREIRRSCRRRSSQGTRVEVSDLFYATPARLKFLKTDRTEAEAIREVVRRLAMARPDIAFTLAGEERAPVTWAAALPGAAGRLTRLGDILGADFRASAIEVRSEREGVVVEGFAAAPSLTRANALGQYLFVNGRPVRDKLILGAVRAAYSDYLPRDRHPVVALFVTLRSAGGRRQCASGQDRGALPQCRPGPRADRACAEGRACPRRQAHRGQQRRRGARRVPPVVRAAPGQLGLAALAGLSGRADAGASRARRRPAFAEPGQAAFDVGAPTADVRFQRSAIGRPARPPARRGAHADPRDLYRVADPRRAHRRGPARRA